MANERTFSEQRAYERRAYEWQLTGRGLLRRRALGLIVIGLTFVFLAGVNLDVFDATVGCIAAVAGGTWYWCLGNARCADGANEPSAAVGRDSKLYSARKPAPRRDPYFP